MTSKAVLRRRPVLSWAFYDWANSAFATTVMAGFFPVFFKQYWNAGVVATESTFRLGVTSGIASLIVALLAPVLGAIADRSSSRVRLLLMCTVLGAAATAGLALVAQGHWLGAAALYVVASLGFWGGIVCNDSLLLHVAEPDEYDVVSGFGYALGYLGGGLLFAVNVFMTLQPAIFGLADAGEAVRVSFVMTGIWWFVFALPCVFFVREKAATKAPVSARAAVRLGFSELRTTLGEIRRYKSLMLFLIAYVLYIDGVNTIIKMAIDYGMSLGLDQGGLIKALLLTQFVGFPAALAYGWLGRRIGALNGIFIALAVYIAATCFAYFVDDVSDFFLLAVVIGLVQGGIQSLSRSYYGRLVPEGKSSEFFGFYNMMGKASAIVGSDPRGRDCRGHARSAPVDSVDPAAVHQRRLDADDRGAQRAGRRSGRPIAPAAAPSGHFAAPARPGLSKLSARSTMRDGACPVADICHFVRPQRPANASRPLVAAIEADGWSVWWDPEIEAGQEFDRRIAEELKIASAVLVVWTPTSVESRWVRGEARVGADRGVLVPVRFGDAELPIDVRALHTTDLDGWRDDPRAPQAQDVLRSLARDSANVSARCRRRRRRRIRRHPQRRRQRTGRDASRSPSCRSPT